MARKEGRTNGIPRPIQVAGQHPDIIAVPSIGVQEDHSPFAAMGEKAGFASIGLHLYPTPNKKPPEA